MRAIIKDIEVEPKRVRGIRGDSNPALRIARNISHTVRKIPCSYCRPTSASGQNGGHRKIFRSAPKK
jgi:hypothetical protein